MESKQILDKLNQARRALDSLSQVEIMDEWQLDNELNVWYLLVMCSFSYSRHDRYCVVGIIETV